ncbi:IS110-like element ISEch3 family transposase [Dickeya dadantii]|uniref:Transposase n=4 Tax=Dickeya dadantii TaxID=204038 RepID=E0SHZ0_DICD3|nr:IS110-like element ISEch3 family transposase [Dickeya dadantii]ADM98190.1 ISEch3 transposase [Dickeya dadantii 3937]ADM99360.1 ISEch3 transposase [Dickeya dadantii 3937]ADN00199.1 Transposase [Dickeya dadantii 3937]NAT78778.1 IS110 family transposase ISEch3 [Dickeya dadantii]UAY95147.1 IS110-like element ISEch3 family transposase [Dickeya dadantii]
MQVSTLGIDLAKNVFQLHGVDNSGKTVLRKRLTRNAFLPFLAQLPPCLIGMEACASAHHFARRLMQYGHQVRLMPPSYVKPYVKRDKTDARDAEAICEAVARPNMRFVAVKSETQQAILALHTERDLLIRERVASTNSLRAMLAEFGVVMETGLSALYKTLPVILEDGENALTALTRRSAARQLTHLRELEHQIAEVERELSAWFHSQEACRRLEKVPGVGMLTATYMVAAVGDGSQFTSSKQFAAWVGLTPKEHSSGGKQWLGPISKRGDRYFRYLLIHGARALAAVIERHRDKQTWFYSLLKRKPFNVAVVAQAGRTARILWSMLRGGSEYREIAPV